MITFDEVITKLNAKKIGSNYMARCPAHDDHDPSLSIREGENGQALLKCFAGCSYENIVKVLNSFDINTNKSYSHPYNKKDNSNFTSKIYSLDWIKQNSIAAYIYRDEENNPKFLVRKYKTLQENKKFMQYSFIDSNTLKPGLNNQKTFLYRLPELIQAVKDHKDIYIVEGEKDVENLYKIGLIATTSPMGGGKNKWKEHYNDYFKNAKVIILPDNDKVGREHAENIASNLSGLASFIKIINLPDLKEKEDVSDWLLTYHHTKEELLEIVQNGSYFTPELKEEKKSKITPVEPLPASNDKIYTIEEVREKIINVFHEQKDGENILIKTLAGTGKTVTLLKEINKIMEEEKEGDFETFVIKEKYLKKIINKNKKDNTYTVNQIAALQSIENKKMRYSEMFQFLHGNSFTIEDATSIILNSLPFKNCKFAYSAPFIHILEGLQNSGVLPEKHWKVIYSRKQKDDKNPDGNCYRKKEIDELLDKRINPTNKICNHIDCPHYKECSSNENMYIGQWNTNKNIALTHTMLAMARGRLKNTHRLIIDENPINSFMETVSIINTTKLENNTNRIDLAIRDFEKSLNPDDKKALPLFKALKNIIYNTRLTGRKEKRYTCVTGNEFMAELEKEYYKLSLKHIEHILEIPNIRENDNFHFRQDLHNILKEEILLWKEKGNYNSRIYIKYYQSKKNSPERVEFYFRNKRELQQDYKSIIALDATTDTLIWNELFNTDFKELKMNVKFPEGYRHIQSITAGYGKNYHNQCLNSTDRKLIDKEIELYKALGGPEKVAIFGWKKVIEYIAKELNLSCHDIGSNFYGIKGSNQYENYETALILGTSNVNINELKELTSTLFYKEDAINFETKEEEVRYNANIDGKDYTIKIMTAIDKRYNAMWKNNREGELTQVANRVRPLLHSRTIVSLSNIPLPDLPPTELIEFPDLLKKCKEENTFKKAAEKIEIPEIPEFQQDCNKEEKEGIESEKELLNDNSNNIDIKNIENLNVNFMEIVNKNLWFCEKYKQILIELFKVKESLVNSQCYQVTKVLYNIVNDINIKKIDSLIALLLPDNTLDFTSVSLLSKDKMFYQRLFDKFCKTYNLKKQKNIISEGKGKMFYLNVSFIPSFPSEELDVNVIKAEYEKFNKFKEKGQVLKLMFNINTVEQEEEYTEEEINLAAAIAEDILNSEPVFKFKTPRSVFVTSPHIPCLLNCDKCRNLNQCAAEHEEDLRCESELCLT